MVDITDAPDVGLEEEVVLLGRQGAERVSAEQLAEWSGTINYEVVTRIARHVPRVAVNHGAQATEETPYRAPRRS